MLLPAIPPRVEEAHNTSGMRINAANARALVVVASKTSQSKIACLGCPAMFSSDDMIDFKRIRHQVLGEPTVFATIPGASPHQPLKRLVHGS
jgi:hypothetical protein